MVNWTIGTEEGALDLVPAIADRPRKVARHWPRRDRRACSRVLSRRTVDAMMHRPPIRPGS
jgi:hypothetical protein